MKWRCLVAAALSLAILSPAVALGPGEVLSDPALEARARSLSKELRCMVCQNQSIDDSDAPLARDLRILVRERLQAGECRRGGATARRSFFGWGVGAVSCSSGGDFRGIPRCCGLLRRGCCLSEHAASSCWHAATEPVRSAQPQSGKSSRRPKRRGCRRFCARANNEAGSILKKPPRGHFFFYFFRPFQNLF